MKNKILPLIAAATLGWFATTKAKNVTDNTMPSSQQLVQQQAIYSFMENRGQIIDQNQQTNTSVLYQLSLPGLNVSLKKNGFSYDACMTEDLGEDQHLKLIKANDNRPTPHRYNFKFHRVDIDFLNSNLNCKIEAEGKAPDYTMFYTTGTSEEGAKVFHYQKVVYKNLYTGIDLEFVAAPGTNKPVEYNFIVHPSADIAQIKMRYTGALTSALKNGALVMKLAHTELIESIPASWIQETNQQMQVSYKQLAQDKNSITIGFTANNLNKRNTLIIDPSPYLDWGTYYGGTDIEDVYGIAKDILGNILIAGGTYSTNNIATTGAHETTIGGSKDAFIVKLNKSGVRQWGTYFGGNDWENSYGLATDASGNVLVTGETNSTTNIATLGVHQEIFGGDADAFIVKFNASGVRQWGTYYGGTSSDFGYGIVSDASGNVFITGNTRSSNDITTIGAQQTTFGGGTSHGDAFIVKLNASGVRQWGTYYGGANEERGQGIATDISGNLLITGWTNSTTNIASTGAYQTTISGGNADAFIVKFNTFGTRQWGTYYGGAEGEDSYGITTDDSSNILIIGATTSIAGIATIGAHQTTLSGGTLLGDAFIVKFNTSGVRQWGTYYGGTSNDFGYGVATDASGNILITGGTQSSTDIATTGAHQLTYGGGLYDAYVAKFSAIGIRQWGTYYGGDNDDRSYGISVDTLGNIFLTGITKSYTGIATTGAHQITHGGNKDVFIARFSSTNVGINEISKENLYSVYPNPAQSVIHVNVQANLIGSAYVVYDNTGKTVLTGKIISENTIIELGNLSEGIYLLSIGENMKQTFKVIKQ